MQTKKDDKNVLVLFSGGVDSTACLIHYKNLGYNIIGLFIDYGQPAATQEKRAVSEISKYLGVKTIKVHTNIKPVVEKGVFQGRNYFFLSQALLILPFPIGVVSLGIHSGTSFPDCSTDFISKNQSIFDIYTNGNIILDCPFINLTKKDIIKVLQDSEFPISYTYSCEVGNELPCGKCLSCLDLKHLKK